MLEWKEEMDGKEISGLISVHKVQLNCDLKHCNETFVHLLANAHFHWTIKAASYSIALTDGV